MTTRPITAFADHELRNSPAEPHHHLVQAHVLGVAEIAPHLRRIELTSPDFHDWTLTGPDEFFGLVMPPEHLNTTSAFFPLLENLPRQERANLRSTLNTIAEDQRPALRWYTVRHLDTQRGTMAFDIATHGVTQESLVKSANSTDADTHADIGPGLRWALHAQPGDPVGIFSARGLWDRRWDRQLVVADASSVPSALAIAEFMSDLHPGQLQSIRFVITVESEADMEASTVEWLRTHAEHVKVLYRPIAEQADAALTYLQSESHAKPDYVWVSGEGNLCKDIRRLAIKEWGLETDAIFWCPYWYIGRPPP
ncbi:siderophore-interacting protein [Corynebacterium ramonii]|uniref:Vibriobactin utilization protein n=1 Tax=Corynebacterium ramonii TaxID=3026968 RepID=A0ABM5RT14_9CORY|nr:siderophore-interacting protein [Corynebacterium ramonii]AIU33108.1 Vibriobactin utilization protein [Corynebacterium ramonii FRC0011]